MFFESTQSKLSILKMLFAMIQRPCTPPCGNEQSFSRFLQYTSYPSGTKSKSTLSVFVSQRQAISVSLMCSVNIPKLNFDFSPQTLIPRIPKVGELIGLNPSLIGEEFEFTVTS